MKKHKGLIAAIVFVALLAYNLLGGDPELIDKSIDQVNQGMDTVDRAANMATGVTFGLGVTE